MTPLHRLARRATRRLVAARFIRTLGVALLICFGAGALAVLTGRLIGSAFPWWWAAASGAGLALVFSGIVAWRSRPTSVNAAAEVDAAMKLQDRLGSALALEARAKDDCFASITIEEATAMASRVRIERAIPIGPDRSWWWWVVAAAACVGIGIFVPPLRSAQEKADQAAAIEQIAARTQADEAIAEATKKLEEALDAVEPEAGDFAMADHQAVLDDIRKQMEEGLKEPDEAAAEAARLMEQTADSLEAQATEELAAEAAAQDIANKAAEELAPEAGSQEVDRLIEAMRQGDAEAALKAAEDLEKAAENMTDEQIQKAAERLDQFSKAMEQAAKSAEKNAAEQAKQSEKDMQNRGMSGKSAKQMAQDAADGSSIPDLQKRLQQEGMSEQAARDAAQALKKSAQQQKSLQQAAKRSAEASKCMSEGAENMRQCSGNGQSKSGNPGQSSSQSSSGSKSGQNSNSGQPGGAGQQSGSQSGGGEWGEGKEPGDGGGTGSEGEGVPAGTGTASPNSSGQPGSGAGTGTALHNLKQKLTGAATKTRRVQRMQQQAQELRVTKQDLLRNIADKSFKEKQEWIKQELAEGAHDKNWRYNDDTIDVRKSGEDGEVVSQQLRSGDAPTAYDPGAIGRRQMTSDLSTAMETAERAIEDRVIPSRYSTLLQRYFEKTKQRAESPDAAPAEPAPDAPDAGKSK